MPRLYMLTPASSNSVRRCKTQGCMCYRSCYCCIHTSPAIAPNSEFQHRICYSLQTSAPHYKGKWSGITGWD
ncbi:hypothetical protein KC19_10G026900 [Ceratodon purpureus]|uniref:Uncharacterized protein n=1 Tax=Ceratodon purpureus TaxID=3225 RepID=A0A8T0GN12_CERPU|nr:hypothetical protein KC19_10G026900 [Ceratodon purpureus]